MQDEDTDTESQTARKRLVIAGASGSIGTALCQALSRQFDITAITHLEARAKTPDPDLPVTWRHCDLFSRTEMATSLAGADYAIYLVHTRLPSARLDQAQCEDMDLIIADNFARASNINGAKQILCLRGLLPVEELPAEAVERRNEVVDTLGAYGTPVTVIRASLVVAPGSTAVNLIGSQVIHGRFVPIPRWTLSPKQPVAVDDLIRAVRVCLGKPEAFAGSFDIGGPEVLNWREVLEQAAELQGRQPVFVPLRWLPRRVYAWWLRRRSRRTHPATIRMLVEDLQYGSLASDNPLQRAISRGAIECREAIRPYLDAGDRARLANPRSGIMGVYEEQLRESSNVRSIQRIRLPAGQNAEWMAETYFGWLQEFVWPFVACRSDRSGSYRVKIRGLGLTLLELSFQPEHSSPDRRMYFITGGLLASGSRNVRGRMEFHDILDGRYTIVAIHDFAPALPWNFYQATQATAHGFVMRAFQRHMSTIAGG
ncbi:MAG: NAD-dependent epimerase/dehydratase family protein [Chromatiales bacterium]|nr:NAD-dependent epimerase/dehydratase family protein [Chromatiales bacterium]